MLRVHRAGVVFRKELTDTLRDRKSLLNVLLYGLLGPLTLALITTFLVQSMAKEAEKVLRVPVVGAEYAPRLIEALADRNIRAAPPPADPREAVIREGEDLVLVVGPDYPESIRNLRPAKVTIITDGARTSGFGHVSRVRAALLGYSQILGAERLIARGVSPAIVSPLSVEEDDTAPPEASGAAMLSMIPIFVVMSLVMGAAYSAVDSMAGERERGSLEPLFATAVTDAEIVVGKALALVVLSVTAAIVTTAGFAIAVALVPNPEEIGMRFGLSPLVALQIALTTLPLAPLVASTLLWLASLAKTVRDANSRVMILGLLPTMAGMPLVLGGMPRWVAFVPFGGQQLIISELLRGSPMPARVQAAAAILALALGALVTVLFIARQTRARLAPQ